MGSKESHPSTTYVCILVVLVSLSLARWICPSNQEEEEEERGGEDLRLLQDVHTSDAADSGWLVL